MPINIRRDFYTMASTDDRSAEIVMYGDIVETRPVDWWTGEPLPGEYITESEFMEDLNSLSSYSELTIRMNSCGGDAGVAVLIHNRLRELAQNGVKLTCIVDGVAMSGGSLIMCACDTVRVNPSSLVMIHKCWSFLYGGYNADELRHMAEQSDAYDKAQVSIYSRKCGLSDTQILHMMSDETYMTGREAVEKGFADELIEDADTTPIAASADRKSIYVSGRQIHVCAGMRLPENIPVVSPEAAASADINSEPECSGTISNGGNEMNESELRAQFPELVAQIEAAARASATNDAANAAVAAERQRLQEIDAIAGQCDPAMVAEARYGEHACDARELAFRAMQRASERGQSFLTQMQDDAANSGAGEVNAATTTTEEEAEDPRASGKKAAAEYQKMKGGKR